MRKASKLTWIAALLVLVSLGAMSVAYSDGWGGKSNYNGNYMGWGAAELTHGCACLP